MIVQKCIFYTPRFRLEIGEIIPVTVGYETYGRLSPGRDNVILLCHFFSGSSHAAGRYHPDDAELGWWDTLIGPGKPLDTDDYFVVVVDSLCNLNVQDPLVVTTGPATVHPATGIPYGPDFPAVTMRDHVRLQRLVLQSMGIQRLSCVIGPSIGGFQALEWAVTYPDLVDRVIAIASAHKAPPLFALAVCQAGIEAITADPAYAEGRYYGSDGPSRGLTQATFLLTALGRSNAWIEAKWERRTALGSAHPWADRNGRYAFQAEMEQIARERAQHYDANHFVYTARACLLHDIGHGNGGLEAAARNIQARILLLPIQSDLLFPPETNQTLLEAINLHGGCAEMNCIDMPNGHLSIIYECNRLAELIARFLSRNGIH